MPHAIVSGTHKVEAKTGRWWIAVPGFEAVQVLDFRTADGTTYRLQPAETRELFLMSESGTPLRARFNLRFANGLSVAGTTDDLGSTGRFTWQPGEAWSVQGSKLDGSEEWRVVAGTDLSKNESVTVRSRQKLGRIVVTDLPRQPVPLFAQRGNELPFSAAFQSSEAHFRLPEGTYTVGPEEWIEQLGPRSHRGGLGGYRALEVPWTIDVVARETLSIPWNDAWVANEVHRGIVRCTDCPPDAALAFQPVYGAITEGASRSPLWRAVEKDGRFRTDPGSPRPIAFRFARPQVATIGKRVFVRYAPQRTLAVHPGGEYVIKMATAKQETR